ncbi:hypothetical protein O7623_15545 [Solwaraspora sp. WMMD791]|uniref:hypothetical protein n=1 Tax=Solwaraspora sp. WMMD791 TaxID=3016086 RepID=UPI00249CE48D|nr:hypothetical protein [Solwaraspora sp. WMMD791]WFE24851.1 hypothetical protein O7623_15545 [Solwaraspora sp. WMMD791]
MRTLRTALALACVSGALLVGAATPAQAASPTTSAASYAAPDNYHFGTYYTLEACRYFGESLTAAGVWRYYSCRYEWRSGEPQGYYYLYMYN